MEKPVLNSEEKENHPSKLSYKHLFENFSFSVILFNSQEEIIGANATTEKIFGFQKKEILGRNFVNFLDSLSYENIENDLHHQLHKVSKGKKFEPFKVNIRARNRDSLLIGIQCDRLEEEGQIYFQAIIHELNSPEKVKVNGFYSEEGYRLIAENSNDLIRVLDSKLKIEYINEKAHKDKLGYSKEDLIGESALKLIHPDEYTPTRRFMRKVFKEGNGTREGKLRHKNGSWICYEIKAKRYFDAHNNMKFLFISRDISERKKNELKLKESEKKYRNIIENVKDAIVITDFNGKYIYASPQTSMLIDGEKIKPKTSIFRNIHPEDLKKLTPLFQSAAKKRRVLKNQEKDFRIIKKDGSIRWISSSSKNYYNEEGEAIGFIVLLRDTTEKKETELKLMEKEKELRALNRKLKADFQQTAKELRESEEKFRTVADQSHLAILIYQNKKIQYCNQSLCTMTGLSYEQLYSYTLQDILKRINPKNHSKIKSRLNPLTLKKSTFTSNIQIQIQIPSGEKKWVEVHASTIKYQKKSANLVVLTDITEKKKNIEKLKESERTLKQKNIELQKLDELKNDFITISAHELKTPLVPVLGYLELILAQNNNLSDETIEHLEKVQNNAERLKVYIEQLIDVMKIDADKISLRREPCNAVDLLQKVISNLKVELERQNSEIFLDSEDKAILNVDPFRIGQIFSNLLLNATRFTQNGKIFISIQANNDHILFQIRDTGLGIAKKDLAHVFEKFMSIHKNPNRFSKAERGSGLGLYIAKGLVEAHNGKIWIESEGLNKGTTVSFTLPK